MAKPRLHIIYVPGIGDHKTYQQDTIIAFWRIYGVTPHYHAVGWADGAFQPKLDRLLAQIDSYLGHGDSVSLLGFSAGASAVLNAFAARRTQISSVVVVSGKINHPESAAGHWFDNNPAFKESLYMLQKNLTTFSETDKARLLTIYPQHDQIVNVHDDAIIPGVQEWRNSAHSHSGSIAYSLTIGSRSIARFCKQHERD